MLLNIVLLWNCSVKKVLVVLLLTDRVYEWLMAHLNNYAGKDFQSVAKADVKLGELEDERN